MLATSIMNANGTSSVRIFGSYAGADDTWLRRFDHVLAETGWELQRTPWSDDHPPPGQPECPQNHVALLTAEVILLFLGRAYLDSAYLMGVEMKLARRRSEAGTAWVFAVLLDESRTDGACGVQGELAWLPRSGRALKAAPDADAAVRDVVLDLLRTLDQQGLKSPLAKLWCLSIAGRCEDFSDEDSRDVETRLRNLAGDPSLRVLERSAGSVNLLVRSTEQAHHLVLDSLHQGRLAEAVGRRVLDVAGARARRVAKQRVESPAVPLADDRVFLGPSPPFQPVTLYGLSVGKDNPWLLNFLFQTGSAPPDPSGYVLEQRKLIEYFLTSIAIRAEDQWINLGPGEDHRVCGESFARTRMGRDLVALDLELKRFTAHLLHPETESGREFWRQVLRRAAKAFGSTDVPVATYSRVWLTAVVAKVAVGPAPASIGRLPGDGSPAQCALVSGSWLKVNCESPQGETRPVLGSAALRRRELSDEVFKELIVPIVEREVNEGKTFATVRQCYRCIILGTFFMQDFAAHPLVRPFIASGNLDALASHFTVAPDGALRWHPEAQSGPSRLLAGADPESYARDCRRTYERYVELFQDGVAYGVRDEYDPRTRRIVTRSYFSGAFASPLRTSVARDAGDCARRSI